MTDAEEAAEARAVVDVTERLRRRFPTVAEDVIYQVVADYHREFDTSPIRDFVPILVERQARDHLRRVPRQRTGSPEP